MAIKLTKGTSDYLRQTLIDGKTLVDAKMMTPIDEHLSKISENLKNSIATINFSASDWDDSSEGKMLTITHPYKTLDVIYKLYRFEDGRYKDEFTWCELVSDSQLNIYNDIAIQGKIILAFDISI